jgi:molecular chaperone GrpE
VPVDEPPGPATGQVPPEDPPGGAVGADTVEERNEPGPGPLSAEPEQAPAPAEPDDLALRRALADLDNIRKRYERELGRARSLERAAVTAEWLSIVDDLERALDHSGVEDLALLDGVRAVHDQAVALLARLGFPRFEDLGKPFDPSRHEAMGVIDGNGAPGTVAAIVRPGYDGPGAVLRPAGVVVTRGA